MRFSMKLLTISMAATCFCLVCFDGLAMLGEFVSQLLLCANDISWVLLRLPDCPILFCYDNMWKPKRRGGITTPWWDHDTMVGSKWFPRIADKLQQRQHEIKRKRKSRNNAKQRKHNILE
mmetsp:Transcript_38428/g.82817  ORF Transcript_38428/g.82817 Transcript_38428/m.82817 type:complete len:120 (+) Transcript_38428:1901-2260(+)